MRILIVFIAILLLHRPLAGQVSKENDSTIVFAEMQLHAGRILAHSGSIAALANSGLWGAQADISRLRLTQKAWEACNCFSQNGVSVSYFNFNNPRELGSAMSVALFAEPRLTYGSLQLTLRAGAGISYLTRVYDAEANPRNLFFSSPWSGLLLLGVGSSYPLSPAWEMKVSATYHHISNGGQRQPNKGMNFPTVSMGFQYKTAGSHVPVIRPGDRRPVERSLRWFAGFSYNTRAVDDAGAETSARKRVLGFHVGAFKPLTRMHALGADFEYLDDGSLREQSLRSAEPFDHRVVSGMLSHHLLFGKFDFTQSLGVYLFKDYKTPNPVFQRYALQYMLNGFLRIGVSLKAHGYTAEQLDVRMGIVF